MIYIHHPLKYAIILNNDTIINYICSNFNFDFYTFFDSIETFLEFEQRNNIPPQKLKDLDFPKSGVVGGVIRNKQPLLPRGNFEFEVKDRVIIVSKHESLRSIESMFK